MNTLTISEVSDALHRTLAERARANHRSIEDEARCCLLVALESDEALLDTIPEERWAQVEQSVCETIHDQGTSLTDDDFKRYRELARGRKGK